MLKNKVIIVIGGAGLLGKEFVKAITVNQGIVIIADHDQSAAKQVYSSALQSADISQLGWIKVDINSKKSLADMIESIHGQYGRIDAFVNSAYPKNKNYGKSFFDVKHSDFCENISINLGGLFLTCQQIALYFKKQGYGNIITIASIYGVIAPKFEIYHETNITMPVEYAAIKSAVIHLTKYMAKFLKGCNIRVNSISPGGILDKQPEDFITAYREQCLNRGMLAAEDISGSLIYLLSDFGKFVNGQNLIVDDGFCL